jgi:6-methylsalicylate decarboxylase
MPFTIDVHHHILPDFFWQETNDGANPVGGIAPPPWDEASALAFMDDAAIDVAVTSISTPGVHVGDNEFAGTMTQKRPDRFGGFAALPLPDVDGALDELAYALDVLKLDGVVVFSNSNGVYLGDKRFEPVFEELERRQPRDHVYSRANTVAKPTEIIGFGVRPG